MKRLNKRIKAFLIALLVAIDLPLVGLQSVYALDTAVSPGLLPMEQIIKAVLVGSGIIVRESEDQINQLVNNVAHLVKLKELQRQEENPDADTPYRVIEGGGGNQDPFKPNNENKNGRWFGLVGASALGSALLFEKGAVEDIMQTASTLGAYNQTSSETGIVSADAFKTQSTSGQIALQLANFSSASTKQFDDFLHSDWWDGKDITPNDCWFNVAVDVRDILRDNPYFPKMYITVVKKSDDVSFVRLFNNLNFTQFSNSYGSLSYYYTTDYNAYRPTLLNVYEVSSPVEIYYKIAVASRTSEQSFRIADSGYTMTSDKVPLATYPYANTDNNRFCAYCGYKWIHQNDWGLTNNTYITNQTFNNNFPDWAQAQMELLGQQVEAIKLGIQNLSNIWSNTQTQIQTGTASEPAISQAINNWQNPENIPEPEPEPDPEPEPEPEPEEQPEDLPASESAVDQLGQDIFDWVQNKITLPSGIFNKVPFCVPYDMYLLLRSMFPTGGNAGMRNYLMVSNVARRADGAQNPSGITISSHFEASGKSTRTYEPNQWEKRAPVINLDLHFSYTGVNGQKKNLDIVKSVDLKPYSYFAMIIYIATYIAWLVAMFGWLMQSFK